MKLTTAHHTLRELAGSSYSLYREGLWKAYPIALLMILISYLIQPHGKPAVSDAMDGLMIFLFLLGFFVLAGLHACLVAVFKNRLNDKKVTYLKLLNFGLKKSAGVFLVCFVCFVIVAIPAFIFVTLGAYFQNQALIIAGMFVTAFFSLYVYLAPYVYVFMDTRIFESLKVTFRLIKKHWLKVFFVILLLSLSLLISMIIILTLLSFLFKEQVVFFTLISAMILAAIIPFWYAGILVLLDDLHSEKNS